MGVSLHTSRFQRRTIVLDARALQVLQNEFRASYWDQWAHKLVGRTALKSYLPWALSITAQKNRNEVYLKFHNGFPEGSARRVTLPQTFHAQRRGGKEAGITMDQIHPRQTDE